MWHGFDMYGLIYVFISFQSNQRKIDCIYAYTSVSTICSSALLRGLVDLDVLDDQVASIETLGICVRLCVLEEAEQELSGLDWPSSSGHTECLACHIPVNICSAPTSTSSDQEISYPVQHVRFLQRIFSSGRPPCVLGHSPKT
jgi:hypothetical protein